MTDQIVRVYVDLEGVSHFVGRLYSRFAKGRESASFLYDESWLRHASHFGLEPALPLDPAPFHTKSSQQVFGSIGDSAPDRWGRNLLRSAERKRAETEGRAPRTLGELDYLLGVSDFTRAGALRFRFETEGPFLADAKAHIVPPLVQLPALLAASNRFESDEETPDDIRMLLAPGSSLGGARPKASILGKDGNLLIAKFPSVHDTYDVIRWEAVTTTLARMAGVTVADSSLNLVGGRSVLILRRFDRQGGIRIPFLSAMSLLGASDGEDHSYLEIVDTLRQFGAAVKEDLHEIWRRIVFNVLVSNTDDHLRNHAILLEGQRGWRLSPAFDLNPTPRDVKDHVLSTSIVRENVPTASIGLALSVIKEFALKPDEANAILGDVAGATRKWRDVAARYGLEKAAIDRMASAFEHNEAAKARGLLTLLT